MKRSEYEALERFMQSCMEDCAHDREHIRRVLSAALEIARHERPVDLEILIAACLLHDIGRKEELENPTLRHNEVGGEKACRFLLERGWKPSRAEWVRDCIITHRYRSDRPPESLEAKILFDADKLDVTGAMGVARTLIYGSMTAQPLYSLEADGSVSDGSRDSQPSFFREYHFKLKKLYESFHTARARELAAERRATAQAFYENLLREARDAYRPGLLEEQLEP